MKIVINTCFGGFSISPLAMEALAKRQGKTLNWWAAMPIKGTMKYVRISLDQVGDRCLDGNYFFPYAVVGDHRPDDDGAEWFEGRPEDRADPDLVAIVEELGKAANGDHAQLKVVEIPDGVAYSIQEYDGLEHIAEVHRTWA